MTDINVNVLLHINTTKKKLRYESYNKIYQMLQKKILLANNGGSKYIIFEIPSFIIGIPTIHVNECAEYLIKRLKFNEFKVSNHNNILLISWNK